MKIDWSKAIANDYGLTNNNFLYGTYWIRQSKLISDPFLDHHNEQQVLLLVKPLNVPIINYFKENNHWYYITKYIPNTKTLKQMKITSDVLKIIAQLIKKLHEIKVTPNIKQWDWKKQLNLFKSLVATPFHNLTNDEKQITNFLTTYKPQKLVLCHNDLVPGNFLFTNKENCYLLDYEYAMINDPLFDIASFMSETLYNNISHQKEFLKNFNLTTDDYHLIKWWMQYQNLIWYYWASYLFEQTNEIIYQKILLGKYTQLQSGWNNKVAV